MNLTVELSDGHFGAQYPQEYIDCAVDNVIEQIDLLAQEYHSKLRISIIGDLVAGPYQRGDHPTDPRAHKYPKNWEEILINQTRPLFSYLRDQQYEVEYTMGNSERREDMQLPMLERRFGSTINWSPHTGRHGVYRPGDKHLSTHMNLGEPTMPILKESAMYETMAWLRPLRNALYSRQNRSIRWYDHLKDAADNLHAAASMTDEWHLQILDQTAQEIDDIHKESCLENEGIDQTLSRWPLSYLKGFKDAHVVHTLREVYVRTLAVLKVGDREVSSISFGHIHNPFILTREQIMQTLGIEPNPHLQYIVNTGTMVPLTADHGGDHRAHMVFWEGSEPRMYQTFDKKRPENGAKLVNVAGKAV